MNKYIIVLFLIFSSAVLADNNCTSPSFLLFGEPARELLDSLIQAKSPDTLTQEILLSNIVFDSKDEDSTKMVLRLFTNHAQTRVTQSYISVLEIMRERYHSNFVKILTANTILFRVRESYEKMTLALSQVPDNDTIRFLHAGTAIEIANQFPEYLPDARDDIDWIRANTANTDSVRLFFLNLLETKFYYKRGILTGERGHFETAWSFLQQACNMACNSHHVNEVVLWEKRLQKQLIKK